MTIDSSFHYIAPSGYSKVGEHRLGREVTVYYPFRVGDLVKVKNWGCRYTTYTNAFETLTGKRETPFYCNPKNDRTLVTLSPNKLFKVVSAAEHESSKGDILFYIIDNERKGAVIGGWGLKPHKVYPLREGESYDIKIDKIG